MIVISSKLYQRVKNQYPNLIYRFSKSREKRLGRGESRLGTMIIPKNVDDKLFDHLYHVLKDWPRNAHIVVYKDIRDFINNVILSLHVKLDSTGSVSETYLFGKDIYNNRIIGDLRELLVKYSTNYIDCKNEYTDSP